jgi:hypothetical protein
MPRGAALKRKCHQHGVNATGRPAGQPEGPGAPVLAAFGYVVRPLAPATNDFHPPDWTRGSPPPTGAGVGSLERASKRRTGLWPHVPVPVRLFVVWALGMLTT